MEKRYSYLWNFFAVSDAVSFKAVCYICNHTLSYRTTITNLKKHLMTRHPEIQIQPNSVILHEDVAELLSRTSENRLVPVCKDDSIKEKKNEKRPNESASDSSIVKLKKVDPDYTFPRKMNVQTKKHIDNTLLSLFIKDFHTFSLVEDKGFQAFVSALNSQYEIPDKNAISETMLPEMYEKLRQHVEDALHDSVAITLSVDQWPSTTSQGSHLIAVKASFLDQNFDVMSVLLDCYSCVDHLTTDKLNEILKTVTTEWSIHEKITLVVCSCYEMVTNEDLQWDYIDCVIHSISIIVANSVECISNLLVKVHYIVLGYKQDKNATSQLLENQINLGLNPQDLILNNSNEWYSVFIMLQRFVDLEDFVKNTLCYFDDSTFLTKEEWVICREIVEIIKPFEIFMKSLYEEKYLTSSLAIILIKGLETMLKDLSLKSFHEVTQSILSKCIEETGEHFNNLSNNKILLVSTLLDPRFKDVIFEPNVKENLKQIITDIVAADSTPSKEQNVPKREESTSEDNSLSIWKAFQSKASECKPLSNKRNSRASIEIQQYLDDGLLPRNENPMQWWKINGHMYPQLKNLMKQNLATTCTAVPCDLSFSKSSQILQIRRSQLTLEEAKLILFINSNQYLMKIND